jgi:divinyl protochlorophyllide a 8-vinyl-reductase
VGPNVIIQLRHVLVERLGGEGAAALLTRAGLARYTARDPDGMVSEVDVRRLFLQVVEDLGPPEAEQVLYEAGRRTGRYIIENRIPRPAARLMQGLPRILAAPILLRAIAAHAWTFAGSGDARVSLWPRLALSIGGNPLATPGCAWHRGVLEMLFQTLASKTARVDHARCCARGDRDCLTILRMR